LAENLKRAERVSAKLAGRGHSPTSSGTAVKIMRTLYRRSVGGTSVSPVVPEGLRPVVADGRFEKEAYMVTSAELSQINRAKAYRRHARYDTRESTKAALEAFNRRFEDEVDPDRVLPEAERQRRVACLRKAYFIELARASAKARAKKAGRR